MEPCCCWRRLLFYILLAHLRLPVIYLLIFCYFLLALSSHNLQMDSSCVFSDELGVWCSEWYGEVFQCFDAVGWVTGRASSL